MEEWNYIPTCVSNRNGFQTGAVGADKRTADSPASVSSGTIL